MGADHAKREARSYTLEELGIQNFADVFGEQKLTITLPPNPLFGTGEAQAIFNTNTRRWELAVSTHARFQRDIEPVFRRTTTREPRQSSRTVKWTEILPRNEYVERFLYDVDWASTSLGPLETWPKALQAYLNIAFADGQAAVIYWGDDLVALYNQEFIRLVSGRLTKGHDLLGVPFVKIWPELWHDFKPMLDMIAAQGTGLETRDIALYPTNDGIPEETLWAGSFLPIRDDVGKVRGFYNRAREITKEAIAERRARVISAIATNPQVSGDGIYKHLTDSLATSEKDFPMAFVYLASEDATGEKCTLRLGGGYGLPENGHALVPEQLSLYEGQDGFLPHFRKAKASEAPVVLQSSNDSLPKHLSEGFALKGFGEPMRTLAILPLSTSDRLIAILVTGLNPRRPYDQDYQGFVNTLMRSISATVSSAVDREEAQMRAQRLSEKLEEHEKSLRQMAQYGPVGMARFSRNGALVWANDQYYEVTGHAQEPEAQYDKSFMENVIDEDRDATERVWITMSHDLKPVSVAVRLKKMWQPPAAPDNEEAEKQQNMWVLANGYPIIEENELKAFAVSATDISRFKWAEQVQIKSAAAAKEAKRLQENFIDIVSHEMRNPLSAITQLGDAILNSATNFDATQRTEADARRLLKTAADQANTILLCAAHQKRVIDDVLMLSKLDSMLLSITPVAVQPYACIGAVLRMFEAEFDANDIQVESSTTTTYQDNKIDWVFLDPSRLTQILINLITNAIKFTKLEATRRITLRVSASLTIPTGLAGVKWFPTNKQHKDLTLDPAWGKGEPLFICFEVQDTGRGLTHEEMSKLFNRFQQATDETHLKYGGSGLGLFISRELTETQGGEIGVSSQRGKGTTFAFYVKSRRAEAPTKVPVTQPQRTRRPPNPPRRQTQEAVTQKAAARTDQNSGINQRIYVLLCDDNHINSQVLRKQLEDTNCEVRLASHGVEALDFIRKTSVWSGMQNEMSVPDLDVILMDSEMPVMDGLTCTRRIRQLEADKQLLRHIPIIATTGNSRPEQLEVVRQAGVDDVLTKPFKVKECMEMIQDLIGQQPGRGQTKP